MDPNVVNALLHQPHAIDRDRHSLHLERELVAYKPTGTDSPPSWAAAMRRWTGAGLIHLGQRLLRTPPLAQPERHAGRVSNR
jgi:hypothetical protein